MSKEYTFEFSGTKEDFLNALNAPFDKTYSCYYFDNYIIKLVDNEMHFGIERGSHSGGYWFIPAIAEFDNRIELCGEIRYIGPDEDRSRSSKVIENIGLFLLFVLLLPIILIIRLYLFIEWIIRKICNRPKPQTTEDKLFDLMENYLGCIRK